MVPTEKRVGRLDKPAPFSWKMPSHLHRCVAQWNSRYLLLTGLYSQFNFQVDFAKTKV